jgi:hypothetical protein
VASGLEVARIGIVRLEHDVAEQSRDGVPEERVEEPPILTPEEDAERAQRRLEAQEGEREPRWPQPDDPLRQPGELSPPPEHRRH